MCRILNMIDTLIHAVALTIATLLEIAGAFFALTGIVYFTVGPDQIVQDVIPCMVAVSVIIGMFFTVILLRE